MKSIQLSQNKIATVDDADWNVVAGFRWYAVRRCHRFYAVASVAMTKRKILMHRLLTNPPRDKDVHHIDGNGLNNTRANLKVICRRDHISTYSTHKNNKVGYKGVIFRPPQRGRSAFFIAHVMRNRKAVFTRFFRTAEEAARAYDAKMRELFGPLAYQNFPSDAGKVRDTTNGE